jgi:hypothetical protein
MTCPRSYVVGKSTGNTTRLGVRTKTRGSKPSETWELGPRHENELSSRGRTRGRRPDREQDCEKLHAKIKPVNGNVIRNTRFLNEK